MRRFSRSLITDTENTSSSAEDFPDKLYTPLGTYPQAMSATKTSNLKSEPLYRKESLPQNRKKRIDLLISYEL